MIKLSVLYRTVARLLLPVERWNATGRTLSALLLVAYVAVIAVQLSTHDMWRDEAQAWLIARASGDLSELRANLRFEGHPPLWHLVIWPVAQLSANVELMKLVTFVVAVGFGALVALGHLVPPLLRPILLAGFLPVFGYGVISRPYLLGLLLLFGSIELSFRDEQSGRSTFAARLLLAVLLSLTHLMFAVVAFALLAGELLTALQQRRGVPEWPRSVFATGLTMLVVLGLTATFLPDRSSRFVPQTVRFDRLGLRPLVSSLVEASGPVPELVGTRWAALVLTALLLTISGLRAPSRSGPFILAIGVLLLNRLVGVGPAWWHIGVTTFTLIALGLVALVPRGHDRLLGRRTHVLRPAVAVLLLPVLLGQVNATIGWVQSPAFGLPYSGGRAAAASIDDWCRSDCPIVVDLSSTGATISAYLGARPIHRLEDGRDGTFAIWDAKHGAGEISWDALRKEMASRGPRAVGAVSLLRDPPAGFIVIDEPGPTVHDERFLLVVLAPSN